MRLLDTPIEEFVRELAAAEPAHRRVRPFLVAQYLSEALFHVEPGDQLAWLARLREARAAEIAYEMSRENGRYLRSLDTWIAQRGWTERLPEVAVAVAAVQSAACPRCLETGVVGEEAFCECAAGIAMARLNGR